MKLAEQTSQTLQSVINAAVQDESNQVPGMSFTVVTKDGSQPFTHTAGRLIVTSPDPVTEDSVFWIASCTKMITAICCMQLVEKGDLNLDDSEQIESLCPEIKNMPVVKADGTTEPKKKGVTLRMLLTHTAGFGYSFFNETLRDWSLPTGLNEVGGGFSEMRDQALLFQPGEAWEYGVSLDWAGIVVERVTGLRLGDYMKKHIFDPLGLENISMVPTDSMKKNLVSMHYRKTDGKLVPRDQVARPPLIAETDAQKNEVFHSGGSGLFAKPSEYASIIAVLLNDGTCPRTGAKILSKPTIDQMFTNQIPQFPDFGRKPIPASKPDLTNEIGELYPNGGGPQGWGLSFMISGGPTGRSDGTAWWAGLPNMFWWADREKGVGGLVATQVLPFADGKVMGTWAQLEALVYQAMNA